MRLFISYARENKRKVEKIVRILEEGGHIPWFDHKLTPFQDWQNELLNQINQADAFVYMLSKKSVKSVWCKWEYSEAVASGKPICSVRLDDFEYPTDLEALSRLHYVDCSNGLTSVATAQLMRGFESVAQKLSSSVKLSAPNETTEIPAQVDISIRKRFTPQNISRLKLLMTLEVEEEKRVDSVSFSPNGKYLASCSYRGKVPNKIHIWNLNTLNVISTYEKKGISQIHFSPAMNLLLCSTGDDKYLLHLDKDEWVGDLNEDGIEPDSIAFNSDGSLLAISTNYGLISLWELPSVKFLGTQEVFSDWDFDNPHWSQGLAFSPDSSHLAYAILDRRVHLWDIKEEKIIKVFNDHDSRVQSVAYSSNGKMLASIAADGQIYIWDIETGRSHNLKLSDEFGRHVFFSPDDTLLVGVYNNSVGFWETNNFRHVYTFTPYIDNFFDMEISPDVSLIATCSSKENVIRLWGVLD